MYKTCWIRWVYIVFNVDALTSLTYDSWASMHILKKTGIKYHQIIGFHKVKNEANMAKISGSRRSSSKVLLLGVPSSAIILSSNS